MFDMSESTTDTTGDLMASMSQCGISLEELSLSSVSHPSWLGDYDSGRVTLTYRCRASKPEQLLIAGLKEFGMTAFVVESTLHATNLRSVRAIYRRVRHGQQWQATCVVTGKIRLQATDLAQQAVTA